MPERRASGPAPEFRDRLARALANALPEAVSADGVIEVEPLAGGVAPRTYLVSRRAERWVVRLASPGLEGALDAGEEAAVAGAAAAAGLAPAVLGCHAAEGTLVTEYRAGARRLTPADMRRPETMTALAELLAALHRLPLRPRRFEPERLAAQYFSAAGGASLPLAERRLGTELERLARDYAVRYPTIALCHNDLVAANVLDEGRLWLVDFEYAVSAAPVLDLAGVAALNGYDDAERWRLVEAYYRGAAAPFTPAELARVVRLVRLIGFFWALAAERGAADPAPYAHFAAEAAAWLK